MNDSEPTQNQADSIPPNNTQGPVGERLRRLRKERDLTILELATRAGVSAGMISQIERGAANPSIKIIQRLKTALGVNLWEVLDSGEPRTPEDPPFIRRRQDRPRLVMGESGLTKELLSPQPDQNLRFMIVRMPPGSETQDVLIGRGHKGGYVLAGRVALRVGDRTAEVVAGDSFQFRSDLPHQVFNRSDEEATLIWIMSVLDTHL
ncbi:MAG: helix-turn-helix transcriptional regulator [Rhodospirillales bacterium]|nr:helix-turn-helix transcriptional regulator [Rhodospirillales bacterium]MBN8897687.1 helix-turn-helix transcriptional regulator [Rhodospirillales bacterium]